ncbi:TetR/AcrR family transcriptional regulator [Streptomyces sp. 4N509B]|uniref:TetR/AcrR family transcriptional regulator n=1 Tax=Streptomyces sp. 4N509B TaxID=3457413 RepID=UPI003FCFE7A6
MGGEPENAGNEAGVDSPEGAATSIWLRPERSGRGPAPAFDRDRLASAGVALADARGLAAVTMRAVARSLGSAPASLYRYVTTRDELLELMIDRVNGEMSYGGLGTGRWLADLLVLARESRGVYLRHPWLLDATASGSPLGPHAVTYLEHALAAMAPLDLGSRTKMEAIGVMNAVVASLSRAEVTQTRAGGSLQQWQRAQQEYLTRVAVAGGHPHLAAALARPDPVEDHDGGRDSGRGSGRDDAAEGLFDRIVTRVLTGLLRAEGGGA